MMTHYPGWRVTRDLKDTFTEIWENWKRRV